MKNTEEKRIITEVWFRQRICITCPKGIGNGCPVLKDAPCNDWRMLKLYNEPITIIPAGGVK